MEDRVEDINMTVHVVCFFDAFLIVILTFIFVDCVVLPKVRGVSGDIGEEQ